jgi:hypothetical protein
MNPDEGPLVFPKRADRNRISRYDENDKIYFGDHFDAFNIRGEKTDEKYPEVYRRLRYVVANFAGLMSRVLADMLFGETVVIDVKDEKLQNFIDDIMEDNQLLAQLYESELANSRRGDAVFKLRVGQRNPGITDSQSTIIIEEFPAAIYFPTLEQNMTRNVPKQDVIATVFTQPTADGKVATYLHKEIHVPGKIYHEVWSYNQKEGKLISQLNAQDFGYKDVEDTGVNRSLVFHIPNVRDGSGFWGTSDYMDLKSLFFALNNRITKTDNILDKHSDPILAVPPGVIDENGQVRKQALQMFEVDNEQPGFNKPEYIVWNANLDSAFKQIEKLIDMLFLFAEIAPASTGSDQGSGGQAESGRALKFKLLATIRKRNRKIRYYDQALKDMLETAQELAKANRVSINGFTPTKVERPTVKWGDGVINDEVEQTDVAIKRVEAGLSSKADAIADLDGITPDEAKKKVKEIDDEATANLPPALSNNLNGGGTGGAGDPANPPQPPASTKAQQPTAKA